MMSVAELMMLWDGDLCLQLLIDARLLFMLKSSHFYFSPCYAFIIRFCCYYFPAKSDWLLATEWMLNVKPVGMGLYKSKLWRLRIERTFILVFFHLCWQIIFLDVHYDSCLSKIDHFEFSVLVLATSKIMNVKKLLILRNVLFFIFFQPHVVRPQ